MTAHPPAKGDANNPDTATNGGVSLPEQPDNGAANPQPVADKPLAPDALKAQREHFNVLRKKLLGDEING
jgi:hypothetical protein